MGAQRRLYGLCSADDGVIVYVGSTTKTLLWRRMTHLDAAPNDPARPVCAWILSVGSHKLRIVPLGIGTLDDERAEIARRIAAGGPLLNVVGGATPANRRLRIPEKHHPEIGDAHAPEWAQRTSGERLGVAESLPWKLFADAQRAIVPREPLHPHNRTPSQIAALAHRRAARLAAEPATGVAA